MRSHYNLSKFSAILFIMALISGLGTATVLATESEPPQVQAPLAPEAAAGLDPFDPPEATELANCGPWTCTPSQDCVYCGNSFYCRPDGDTCCYPDFCNASEECILCGAFKNCYPKGSTCCWGWICRPDQTCDWVSRRCV